MPPDHVRAVCQIVAPLIRRASSRRGGVPAEELIAESERNEALLWIVSDNGESVGVCFTRRMGDVIEVTLAGGRGNWALSLRDALRQFRRDERADKLRCLGRRGWGRWLGLKPVGRDEAGNWIFEDAG